MRPRVGTKNSHDGERDSSGRFIRGNRTSRRGGNPNVRRIAELRAAVRDAISADDLRRVLRGLRDLALDPQAAGSDRVAAARVLIERCAGKPTPPPTLALDVQKLSSARDALAAAEQVALGVLRGEVDQGDARAALEALSGYRATLAEVDIEERLRALEAK